MGNKRPDKVKKWGHVSMYPNGGDAQRGNVRDVQKYCLPKIPFHLIFFEDKKEMHQKGKLCEDVQFGKKLF